ncbi:MAG: MnhB domain-containing protein [Ignavibacteriaceae bacterium]
MNYKSDSPIILIVSRIIAPYIMLFGLYVIFHGHYSPGGGFQGGAIIAASFILIRITNDPEVDEQHFMKSLGIPLGSVGVIIFFAAGFLAMLFNLNFLDYSYLTFTGLSPADARSIGILIIEIGVGIAVTAILVSLFDSLLGEIDEL